MYSGERRINRTVLDLFAVFVLCPAVAALAERHFVPLSRLVIVAGLGEFLAVPDFVRRPSRTRYPCRWRARRRDSTGERCRRCGPAWSCRSPRRARASGGSTMSGKVPSSKTMPIRTTSTTPTQRSTKASSSCRLVLCAGEGNADARKFAIAADFQQRNTAPRSSRACRRRGLSSASPASSRRG